MRIPSIEHVNVVHRKHHDYLNLSGCNRRSMCSKSMEGDLVFDTFCTDFGLLSLLFFFSSFLLVTHSWIKWNNPFNYNQTRGKPLLAVRLRCNHFFNCGYHSHTQLWCATSVYGLAVLSKYILVFQWTLNLLQTRTLCAFVVDSAWFLSSLPSNDSSTKFVPKHSLAQTIKSFQVSTSLLSFRYTSVILKITWNVKTTL